jgi:hypothetical protein
MTTTINRPVYVLPGTKTESKRVYTIHRERNIFTVQKNGTSVLSFRNRTDAIHFGKMLETHFDMTNEWPFVDFEETVFYKHSQKTNRFKYLHIKYWHEDDIRKFCIMNSFSMLDIVKFEDDSRLIGNLVSWEAPMGVFIDGLNQRFHLPGEEEE